MLKPLSVTSKVNQMSKLLTVLALTIAIPVVAQASEIARVRNNDGGYIVFMAHYCGQNKDLYRVVGIGQSNTIQGCYLYQSQTFLVRWDGDNEIRKYPAEAVTWHPEFIEGIKKDRKTY